MTDKSLKYGMSAVAGVSALVVLDFSLKTIVGLVCLISSATLWHLAADHEQEQTG